jgi:hypothetical protein
MPKPTLSVIQIALDAINYQAPHFQTSFGPLDFGDPDSSCARIEAGTLIVTSENQEYVSITLEVDFEIVI